MSKTTNQGISRRSFIGMGAVAAMAAGAAGLAGCAPAGGDSTAKTEDGGHIESVGSSAPSDVHIHNVTDTSWMTPPAEVTDFAQEWDCEVVVCGHGFAGITACRELAEQGKKVILIEKQPEDTYQAVGNEFAALNAKILQERGVPHIDPVEFYQNFMKITSNMPNPSLVMRFAQNSEENSNWYLDRLTEEDFATMTTAFFPPTEHQLSELSGIKFWPSVCSFYGECNQTKIQMYNQAAAEEKGAEFHFATTAEYIIMENGAVAGLVASDEGGYIKINCKAVVCACGGMGGNPDMMAYFMPDMAQALVEGESLNSMSANDGRGVQMAYWAGAHLETTPIPGMNMKGLSVPGKMNCLPQAVWIDENGKRFCNEYYPTSEQRGYQTAFMSRKTKYAVCDNNFTEYRQYTLPQHAGFNATEENIAALRESLDKAYAKFKGTYEEPEQTEEEGPGGHGPMTQVEYIADDTLEGLAGQLGLSGDAATEFVAQIERYNGYCETGVDEEFGRAKEVLFPVKDGPFYASKRIPTIHYTMGGVCISPKAQVLTAAGEVIPGLYAAGEVTGGVQGANRLGGNSYTDLIVFGRIAGASAAAAA